VSASILRYLRSSAFICGLTLSFAAVGGGKDDAFPFQPGVLEVEDEANRESGDTKIVQHLSSFMVGNLVNAFGIHNDFSESDEIRDELADVFAFVKHLEVPLLVEVNAAPFEFHDQRILVQLLIQAVAQFVEHLECATDDGMRFLSAREGVRLPALHFCKIICVHLHCYP
jgi:hypothetical protein